MTFQGNFTTKFSTRVLKKLKMPIKTIAFYLGVPYKTYYNWREGISTFPPDLLEELYGITKDARIFKFFLHRTGFMLIEDPRGKGRKLMKDAVKAVKELWEFLDHEKEG